MNKSSLYSTALTNRNHLIQQLNKIDEYLTEGEATTTITFYDKNGLSINSKTETSKWSTSIGKSRIETMHKDFIYLRSRYTIPAGTAKIVVCSPFADNVGATTIQVAVPQTVTLFTSTF